jgi:hypothetical protein
MLCRPIGGPTWKLSLSVAIASVFPISLTLFFCFWMTLAVSACAVDRPVFPFCGGR